MLYNGLIFPGLTDKYAERNKSMLKEEQLEQIRQDILSFLDEDNLNIDIYTKKNLLKGIINNFFDCLQN